MIQHYRLGPDGEPIPCELETWAKSLGLEETRIAWTVVGVCEVSTIFLGVEHGYREDKPVLWETMLFQPPHGPTRPEMPAWGESEDAWETYHSKLGEGDGQQWRWTSQAEALAGHRDIVERLKDRTLKPTKETP